ncbi:VOC family protein [Nonomuraea sp. NBC_01738]|uniref:VOC family protein n=1 Tax=Nonomuraea sp. NBC_01738 TaxID=2976003 RepID=UPI002E0D5342|nr:VOC family protein [Nonomuraea sp. NBC_01738]
MDHLVYATPDLAPTVAEVERLLGVKPAEGGRHVGLGTRNHLLGLGGRSYLEIIGPDPEQPHPGAPRPFGIDTLDAPRLVAWAVEPDDLDATVAASRARGYDPGTPFAMSRRTPSGDLLEWRLAFAAEPDPVIPFLIDWGTTPHPRRPCRSPSSPPSAPPTRTPTWPCRACPRSAPPWRYGTRPRPPWSPSSPTG